jgi:capsular polysaccharide biosynthesis protein
MNRLRDIAWIYRLIRFGRHSLWPALQHAVWEFYRFLAHSTCSVLYSTPALQRDSALYAWLKDVRHGPPFEFFSAYQALRAGYPLLRGRIVLEDQGTPKVVVGTFLAEGHTQQHVTQPWPVFWSHHAGAHLVTGSLALLTPEKKLCVESVYGYRFLHEDPAVRYFNLPSAVRLAGNWTSVVSRWVPNNGGVPNHSHWLLDVLPRLALLKEFPADTRVLIPARLAAYQRESLAMLGLTEARLRPAPETHLEVENFYFSSPPSMIVCHSPHAVQFLRDNFLPLADPHYQGPKRFYITRRNVSRNTGNNAELEAFFQGLGWGVVDLCTLTFAQEIRLFAEAEAVCGVFGSGLTNVIFSRPECAVISMAHDFWVDGVLDWIVQVVGIQKYSARAYPSDACRRWRVDLAGVQEQLDSLGLK